MPELVKVGEAARRLGVSTKTLYRFIAAGKLRSCVIRLPSGRIRLDWEALLEELRHWTELRAVLRSKHKPT